MSHIQERQIQIDFSDHSVIGDLNAAMLRTFTADGDTTVEEFPFSYNDTYREQLRYFFDRLKQGGMMNSVVDAKNLFEKILRFKKASVHA